MNKLNNNKDSKNLTLLANIDESLEILNSNNENIELNNYIDKIIDEIRRKENLLSHEDLENFQKSFNLKDNNEFILEILKKIKKTLEKENSRKKLDYHLSKQVTYSEVSYSLRYLIDEFSSQNIEMPKYQRAYVWEKKQAGELILSFLRGIPIPKLYGYHTYNEEKNRNIKLIIDGQQRITSILMWYYGIFPKFKVRSINYSENMSTIVRLCNYYYDPETYQREANRLDSDDEAHKMLEEIEGAKEKLEKTYKLNLDVQFEVDIINENGEAETIDLSFRNNKSILTRQEKQDLLDTELGFVIVKGKEGTETVDIFRLYNSSGTPLSSQEIRNGIYYRSALYKKINEYNDDTGRIPGSNKIQNKNWNNIRPSKENKKDVKQLFSLLSLAYSYKNKKCIDEEREVLIDQYSSYISKNTSLIDREFNSIKNFFDMTFESSNKNIKTYIALFIVLKHQNFLNEEKCYKNIRISKEIIEMKSPVDKDIYLSKSFLEKLKKQLIKEEILDETAM